MQSNPAPPDPRDIAEAIVALRADYARQGHTPWDIGNGLCDAFASDLLTRLIGSDWIHREGCSGTPWLYVSAPTLFALLPGQDTTEGATSWDWPLIERLFGAQVPFGDRDARNTIVDDFLTHDWVWMGGRHYDCEHPEGVSDFFDLSFFKRHLDARELPRHV